MAIIRLTPYIQAEILLLTFIKVCLEKELLLVIVL